MSRISPNYPLEPPERYERNGKVRWDVPVHIKIYPTDTMAEFMAVVQFLDPRSGRGSHDIIELGDFHAQLFESSMEREGVFVDRRYSAIFQSSQGAYAIKRDIYPGWAPVPFSNWIEKRVQKKIHDYFMRVCGWRNTSKVFIRFLWQLHVGD